MSYIYFDVVNNYIKIYPIFYVMTEVCKYNMQIRESFLKISCK